MAGNKTLRWLFRVPGRKKLNILALTLIHAVHGGFGVVFALFLRQIVDAATTRDRDGFWRFLGLLIGLILVQLALQALIRWLTERSKAELENVFAGRLTNTLMHKDYLQVSAVHSGEWMNRLTADAKTVADAYVDILPGLAGMVVKLISALVMVIVLEPRFAAILIPSGLVLVLTTGLFRKKMKTLHRLVRESDGRLRVFLQERIGGMLMIRSFAAEARTSEAAQNKMDDFKNARMRRTRFSNWCNTGFGLLMYGMYLLGVGWCGYGILMGTVSFGTLTAITQLISQIQAPFASISGYLPRYYAMLASAERLMEAENFRDAAAELKTVGEAGAFYDGRLESIGLDRASFAYYPAVESPGRLTKAEMPIVLNNLSLELRKGEYVAFTGQSGCGKSTVLKLLMCVFQPDSGTRYYSDRTGRREPLTDCWRRLFAYVPQGNQLMQGTVREIVSFAAPEKAEDTVKIASALRLACADDFVAALEQGIDTQLGERGAGLSEGQTQRLAIARAVFSDSPILLMDEATSALDADTERRLLRNLRTMTDRTVVIVTHRPAALEICDRVLRFTEQGIEEIKKA